MTGLGEFDLKYKPIYFINYLKVQATWSDIYPILLSYRVDSKYI